MYPRSHQQSNEHSACGWRYLLERLSDSDPAALVRILDESVALLLESGNSTVEADREVGPGSPGIHMLWRLWLEVRNRVPDRRERQVFVLMLCGSASAC